MIPFPFDIAFLTSNFEYILQKSCSVFNQNGVSVILANLHILLNFFCKVNFQNSYNERIQVQGTKVQDA